MEIGDEMKKKCLVFFAIILFCAVLPFQTNATSTRKNVYVIPIGGEIGPAVFENVRNGIKIAEDDPNAVGIIFEIDTYGGRIDSAVRISRLMLDTPLPTISFVNTKAVSAGVLLTISADTIVMAPGSTIGSAETIPKTEKILSDWTSSLRTVAQEKGRDPELVAAMADASIEIPNLIEKDRLLNLTTQEAYELGFIDFVDKDLAGIMDSASIEYDEIINIPLDSKVKLAQFMTSSHIAPLFLSVGFIGFLVEIFTPGFGIAGTISFIAFALYFGGAILAGNTGWAVLMIFLVGLILLLIEASIPGFGIPGIGGIICVVISIFMVSGSAFVAAISLFTSFLLTLITLILLLKYAPRNQHFNRIVLATQMKTEQGYRASGQYHQYLGKQGVVVTHLRPSGTIDINGDILDVVSEGTFIEMGSRVEVIKVEGRRIIVKKID